MKTEDYKYKKITIVILTYNSEKDIFDCLQTVYQYNDIGDDLEVIVVDNNSLGVDKMFSNIAQIYPNVILVKNSTNAGYGAGNNVGIKIASAPIIMIMNPDVRLLEPIFSSALNSFQDNSVVLYGMKQMLPSGNEGPSFFWTLLDNSVLGTFLSLKIFRPKDWYLQNKMYISGACFFVRKSDFEKVGLFDENLFLYAEEDDIRIRLLSLGNRKIIYDKNKKYLHFFEDREVTLKKLHRLFVSKCYLCSKNGVNLKYPLKWEKQYYRLALKRAKNKLNEAKILVYTQWLNILDEDIDVILNKNV